MRPEIKLFFDFEFTSLSPDAQPISLGIVSEEIENITDAIDKIHFNALFGESPKGTHSKSFYSEFSDFDLNRCDDWVKENVVSKLKMLEFPQELGIKHESALKMLNSGIGCVSVSTSGNDTKCTGSTSLIKQELTKWLSQFSDYNIQFVCDCGTFDWYWMLQLLAVWDSAKYCAIKNTGKCQVKLGNIEKCPSKMYLNGWDGKAEFECQAMYDMRFGLPKLPSNISPIPQDLNDLIALKKGISTREAFDMDRDELFFCLCDSNRTMPLLEITQKIISINTPDKHNSLADAKVIKAIYEKLS